MSKSPRRPMIEVRRSKVHGSGVFALRRIRKGTTIIEYLGDRVSHEEADERYEHKAADDNHTFLFTVDSKTVIDGGVDGNDARFINHGCDPNCESASQGKRIFIEAVRTIHPGDELAYDYQIQRDSSDPPDVDRIFACRCGAAACRGTMLVPPKKRRNKRHRGSKIKSERLRSKAGKNTRTVARRSAATRTQAARHLAKKSAPASARGRKNSTSFGGVKSYRGSRLGR